MDAVTQELKLTVIRGREQRDKLMLEVDRLKQARVFCKKFCTNDITQLPFLNSTKPPNHLCPVSDE